MTGSEQIDGKIRDHPDWRGITFSEKDTIKERAFRNPVRSAVGFNGRRKRSG